MAKWEVEISRSKKPGEVFYINTLTGEATFKPPPGNFSVAIADARKRYKAELEEAKAPLPSRFLMLLFIFLHSAMTLCGCILVHQELSPIFRQQFWREEKEGSRLVSDIVVLYPCNRLIVLMSILVAGSLVDLLINKKSVVALGLKQAIVFGVIECIVELIKHETDDAAAMKSLRLSFVAISLLTAGFPTASEALIQTITSLAKFDVKNSFVIARNWFSHGVAEGQITERPIPVNPVTESWIYVIQIVFIMFVGFFLRR